MQIHELNNFTGTLGSGAYLAIDDGNDTGKISSQGLLAATEARIDNIIAGPAPSAEEIVDARLGADGVTYPSLGDAIRDQFTDVKSALNAIGNDQDFGYLSIIDKKQITSANEEVDNGLISHTDYIRIPENAYSITVRGITTNAAGTTTYSLNPDVLVYDENKVLISSFGVSTKENEKTHRLADISNAKYVRVNQPGGFSNTSKHIRFNFQVGPDFELNYQNSYALEDETDFDDITAVGNYRVSTYASAQTMLHIPTRKGIAYGGRLVVMTLNASNEYAQVYYATNSDIFYRCISSGDWTEWVLLYDARRSYLYEVSVGSPALEEGDDLNELTAGSYRITTSAIAKTVSNVPIFPNMNKYSGRIIVSEVVWSNTLLQEYIASEPGYRAWRAKNANGWSEWQFYSSVDNTDEERAKTGASNSMRNIQKTLNYDISFANSPYPIPLINYIGNTQNCHPKVLYFEDGFGGHAYWMAYTPYPFSNDDYENPCIAYSDDGFNWTNIPGNPLDDPNGVGFDSDTHLVYNTDTELLECWYRYTDPTDVTPQKEMLYRKTSEDGVTWSDATLVYTNANDFPACAMSPSIIYDNGTYHMWMVNQQTGFKIDYYTATDNGAWNWSLVRSFTFELDDEGITVKPWHIDVIKDGGTYILLMMCRNSLYIENNICSVFVTTSADNITYNTPAKVISGNVGIWDKWMYRSSIVKVGNVYRIYYSACLNGGSASIYNRSTWGIGITESATLQNFIQKYISI